MAPIINLTLGWVGFIFGFQMELKFLKRINGSWYLILIITYITTFLAIFLFSLLIFSQFLMGSTEAAGFAISIAVILATLLPESSIPFIIWSTRFFRKRTENMRLCVFISSLDNVFPILLTGIIFTLFRTTPGNAEITVINMVTFLISLLMQVIVGILIGGGLYILQKKINEKFEIPTILFGFVFLIAGFSLIFSYSILFTAMISGAIFSNLTKKNSRILSILTPTEKPIYLIFLIFLGIKSAQFSIEIAISAIVLLLIKFNTQALVFKWLHKFKPKWFNISPYYSYLLLPVSSIAPALLLNLQLTYPHPVTSIISGIFILCFVIAELFAPAGLNIFKRKILND